MWSTPSAAHAYTSISSKLEKEENFFLALKFLALFWYVLGNPYCSYMDMLLTVLKPYFETSKV